MLTRLGHQGPSIRTQGVRSRTQHRPNSRLHGRDACRASGTAQVAHRVCGVVGEAAHKQEIGQQNSQKNLRAQLAALKWRSEGVCSLIFFSATRSRKTGLVIWVTQELSCHIACGINFPCPNNRLRRDRFLRPEIAFNFIDPTARIMARSLNDLLRNILLWLLHYKLLSHFSYSARCS